ncbi:hypothetical protein EFBL_2309 [Effusibacillus lacus]|uniref:Uncharacterized protein n=1 Tax=Effusibacillus lacus TaxID=1348429 RepID=A0A292YP31_9BACL|nr:hypothetical protein EDD64_1403 [Effusibacillus lacus]GAX90671.1 hypothetical protein EFBL_2309 [Effusibacillus lacus]
MKLGYKIGLFSTVIWMLWLLYWFPGAKEMNMFIVLNGLFSGVMAWSLYFIIIYIYYKPTTVSKRGIRNFLILLVLGYFILLVYLTGLFSGW